MTISTIDESQRNTAKVVGFTYLLAMATAVYDEMFVRGPLIVPDNIAETARNRCCYFYDDSDTCLIDNSFCPGWKGYKIQSCEWTESGVETDTNNN